MKRKDKRSVAKRPLTESAPTARKSGSFGLLLLAVAGAAAILLAVFFWPAEEEHASTSPRNVAETGTSDALSVPPRLSIIHPLDGAVFPPDIASPVIEWTDTCGSGRWTVEITTSEPTTPMQFACRNTTWSPPDDVWEQVRRQSVESDAEIIVSGFNAAGEQTLSDRVCIRTSTDEVGAPIFYREVDLPFETAVKDPAAHVRWRFGSIASSEKPPVVLENMPLCGNCHSFSADGSLIGMDVDYGSDKGSYAICPVSEQMVLKDEDIITWSDYQRDDNRGTFGLLSRVSPDGSHAVSTVKDRSVFVALDNLAFSQLFFPIQGILAYYDIENKTFAALPGADDPDYVQSNAVWSPDGKHLVFARSKAYWSERLKDKQLGLLNKQDVSEFITGEQEFKYDLYRIPWNDGNGGNPEPLLGASNNGMSNYFPKYSPDGKWIVFCKAKNFMLLQEDAELYIIPSEGGEARRMECNTGHMGSWHSWSPNGKWLVFSSKPYGPYTKLFLTHIDEHGRSTTPVCLTRFTEATKAANIPEFVHAAPDAIHNIDDSFIDDESYIQAGTHSMDDGASDIAAEAFRKALKINPESVEAHCLLGVALLKLGEAEEAEKLFRQAVKLAPRSKEAYNSLGCALSAQGRNDEALEAIAAALEIDPAFSAGHAMRGSTLLDMGRVEEGRRSLLRSAELAPDDSSAYESLAVSHLKERDFATAADMYRNAIGADPRSEIALLGFAATVLCNPDATEQDMDSALEAAMKATQFVPTPSSWATLSDVYMTKGDLANAQRSAEEALKMMGEKNHPLRSHVESRLRECRLKLLQP